MENIVKKLEIILKYVKTKEGKKYLSCKDALKLVFEMDVAPREIGGFCDRKKIKICACQLGCF